MLLVKKLNFPCEGTLLKKLNPPRYSRHPAASVFTVNPTPVLNTLYQLNVFRPAPGKRFSRFDLWIYTLFEKRWTPLLRDNPDVRQVFIDHMQGWHEQRKGPIGNLRAVQDAPGTGSSGDKQPR